MTSQNQDMLNACTSGDLEALKRLFQAQDIKEGSKPVYIATPDALPPTNQLLAAAITKKNLNIVSFLLKTYSRIYFSHETVTTLLNHPDLPILEAVYQHDNSIIDFTWDNYTDTFLTEACKRPSDQIAPLIHFAIEKGADMEAGGLPFQFAVHAAVCGDQPLDVIEAMVNNGGSVYFAACKQAVYRERIDAIQFFMRAGVEIRTNDVEKLRKTAQKTEDVEVMKLVDSWIRSSEKKSRAADRCGTVMGKSKNMFRGLG